MQQLEVQEFRLRDLGITCAPDMIQAVRMLLEERNVRSEEGSDVRRQFFDLTSLIARKPPINHGQPLQESITKPVDFLLKAQSGQSIGKAAISFWSAV